MSVALQRDAAELLALSRLGIAYQPIYELSAGEPSLGGVEALCRLLHPSEGRLYPGSFMPGVEECRDLSFLLDTAVLEEVGTSLPAIAEYFTREGVSAIDKTPFVAVNVSPVSLVSRRVFEAALRLRKGLSGYGLSLVLEVTERQSLTEDEGEDMRSTLEALMDSSIGVAADDLVARDGSRHTSHPVAPPERLALIGEAAESSGGGEDGPTILAKLDKSFTKALCEKGGDDITAIRDLEVLSGAAHSLGAFVVAEGVENPECAALLSGLDVDMAQGFGLSHPITIS